LITRLNSLIIGTANYWKPSSAKETFSKMNHFIWKKVFKFVKRLHPNKPIKWIKEKYFPPYDDGKYSGNWILTGSKEGIRLFNMAWTPIRRHVLIQYNHSPYDRTKRDYFNNRRFSC